MENNEIKKGMKKHGSMTFIGSNFEELTKEQYEANSYKLKESE